MMKNFMVSGTIVYYCMCTTIKSTELLKGWRTVIRQKQFQNQRGLLNLISYWTRWNLEHKGEHKHEDWRNLERIFKNCKVTYKDSVIHKLINYNAKYKFSYTSFIARNTSFNLTKNKKKALHFFCINYSIQQRSN